MHRKLLLLSGLILALHSSGCCMCDAPYDYCGPTFLGGPCEECLPDARMNSAFTPYPGPLAGEVIHEGSVPQSVLQPADPDASPVPGSPEMETPMQAPAPLPGSLPPSTTQGPRARSVSVER